MSDPTLEVVEKMLFRTLKGEPTEEQRAMTARVSAAYQAKYGAVTRDTDGKEFVRRLRVLTVRDMTSLVTQWKKGVS